MTSQDVAASRGRVGVGGAHRAGRGAGCGGICSFCTVRTGARSAGGLEFSCLADGTRPPCRASVARVANAGRHRDAALWRTRKRWALRTGIRSPGVLISSIGALIATSAVEAHVARIASAGGNGLASRRGARVPGAALAIRQALPSVRAHGTIEAGLSLH